MATSLPRGAIRNRYGKWDRLVIAGARPSRRLHRQAALPGCEFASPLRCAAKPLHVRPKRGPAVCCTRL
jgi:hypothetical protein